MAEHVCCMLLLLAGAVSGDYGWRAKQEFIFQVEGRSLTGVTSLKTQYAGIHYSGTLRIQSQTPSALFMKLQNVTYAKLHGEMPDGWWSSVPPVFEEKYRDLPISESTFAVKLDRGVVDSLVVDKSLAEWEVNLVQGLVSQLQLDLSGSNLVHESGVNVMHGQRSSGPDMVSVYRVMEEGVVGRCEVLYEVAPALPPVVSPAQAALCGSKNYMEVTKTRNYDNCDTNAEYHFGLPGSIDCQPGSSKCGDFWSRSSLTRVQGCGDRKDFLTLTSISSSQILANLHFHNGSQASANSYLNVTLLSAKPITKRFSAPNKPLTLKNLFYRFTATNQSSSKSNSSRHQGKAEESHNRQKPKSKRPKRKHHDSSEEEDNVWGLSHLEASQAPHIPFSPLGLAYSSLDDRTCLGQQLKDIVADITADMEAAMLNPEKRTLEKVTIAVQLSRLMTLSDLKRAIGNAIDDKPQENSLREAERNVFRDVVTMSGTDPAFLLVKSWVEEKKLKGEEAAEVLSTLASHLLTPGRETIKRFYDLVRSSAVREDVQILTTAVLSLSNLVRVACVHDRARQSRYSTHMFGPACAPSDVAPIVSWLWSQIRSEHSMHLVYITALGNTGLPSALLYLKLIAEDKNMAPMHRASAVFAMKYLVFRDPSTTTPLLLSLFHNTVHPAAVRIAAASLLFYAQPSTAVWQRLAVSTWYDTNPTVAAFVSSSLASLATLNDPTYKNITAGASAAYPLAKTFPTVSLYRPYNLASTSVSNQLKEMILHQLSWTPGAEATNVYYRHTQRLAGFSRVNFDGEMWLANPDTVLSVLRELVDPSAKDVSLARPAINNLPRATRWLHNNLKIAQRKLPEIEGALRFKLDHLTERMFSFDKKIALDLAKAGHKLLDEIKSEKVYYYQKMDQSTTVMSTATEMGFPIMVQVTVPWVVRASGKAMLSAETKELKIDATFCVSSQLMGDMSLYTAWDHTSHVAAAYMYSAGHLPATRFTFQVDPAHYKLEVGVALMEPVNKVLVAHHKVRAFTTQNNALSLTPLSLAKANQPIRKREPRRWTFNVATHLQVQYNNEAERFNPMKDVSSVHGFTLMMASMADSSVEVYILDPAPITMQIGLGCANAYNGTIQVTRSPAMNNTSDSSNTTASSEETNSTNPSEATESTTSEATESSTTESSTTESTESTTTDTTSESTPSSSTTEPSSAASNEKGSMEMTMAPPLNSSSSQDEFDRDEVTAHSTAVDSDNSNFNASSLDIFSSESDDIFEYLLNETLSGISSGQAHIVGMTLQIHSAEATRYQLFAAYAAAMGGRHHRGGFFFKNDKDNSKLAMTSTLDVPSVPVVDIRDIIFSQTMARFSNDYMYQSDNGQIQWALKGTVTQGWKRMSSLHMSNLAIDCTDKEHVMDLTCRSIARDASYLDQYNITAVFNEGAKQMLPNETTIERMMSPLYPYLSPSAAPMDPTDGFHLVVEMAPNMQMADVNFQLLEKEIQLTEVPLSPLVASVLEFQPDTSIQRRVLNTGFCALTTSKVVTFDGLVFDYDLGDCWHLVTKDCSGKNRIAVMAKRGSNQTLDLEINMDNFKVISMQAGPIIQVNQKKIAVPSSDELSVISDAVNITLAHISTTSDNALKVILPAHGFTIVYTNTTLFISADASMEGRLCGLCGDMDRKMDGEFRSPSDHLERTAHAFAASYAIQDKECKQRPDRKP